MENDTGLLQALLGNFPFYLALDGAESNQLLCHLAPDQCPVQRNEKALKTTPHLNMAKLSRKKMHKELHFFSLYKCISLRDNVHWRNRSQQHPTSHPFCTYWMSSSVPPVTILCVNVITKYPTEHLLSHTASNDPDVIDCCSATLCEKSSTLRTTKQDSTQEKAEGFLSNYLGQSALHLTYTLCPINHCAGCSCWPACPSTTS